MRVASWLPIWMVTRTALGWTSTPSTTSPLASMGSRPTVSLTSSPDGSIRTRASAATTKRTAWSGPETVTLSCETTGSRTSRPGGTVPRSTRTGTCLLTSGSRRTATRDGV